MSKFEWIKWDRVYVSTWKDKYRTNTKKVNNRLHINITYSSKVKTTMIEVFQEQFWLTNILTNIKDINNWELVQQSTHNLKNMINYVSYTHHTTEIK